MKKRTSLTPLFRPVSDTLGGIHTRRRYRRTRPARSTDCRRNCRVVGRLPQKRICHPGTCPHALSQNQNTRPKCLQSCILIGSAKVRATRDPKTTLKSLWLSNAQPYGSSITVAAYPYVLSFSTKKTRNKLCSS
jgi:hypothetical protein